MNIDYIKELEKWKGKKAKKPIVLLVLLIGQDDRKARTPRKIAKFLRKAGVLVEQDRAINSILNKLVKDGKMGKNLNRSRENKGEEYSYMYLGTAKNIKSILLESRGIVITEKNKSISLIGNASVVEKKTPDKKIPESTKKIDSKSPISSIIELLDKYADKGVPVKFSIEIG